MVNSRQRRHQHRSSAPDTCPSSERLLHGVRMRSWGRWVSEIRIPHSRDKIWLGSYSTPEQAARAYDVASILLCRPFPLNFSDSPSLLHLHLSAASSPPSRRSIQATAYLVALSAPVPAGATINCLPVAQEVSSTGCATIDDPYSNARADLNSSGNLEVDSSWMQEVRSLLAPEVPDTMNSVSSTSNIGAAGSLSIQGVLDAEAISVIFDASASSCSKAEGGELQEGVLTKSLEQEQLMTIMSESRGEYEEALQAMLAVDGFTATSAPVTTRQRIDLDAAPSDVDIALLPFVL